MPSALRSPAAAATPDYASLSDDDPLGGAVAAAAVAVPRLARPALTRAPSRQQSPAVSSATLTTPPPGPQPVLPVPRDGGGHQSGDRAGPVLRRPDRPAEPQSQPKQ